MHHHRVNEIALPKSISDHYSAGEPFNSLSGVSRLNVILGPNNSGKSRLMRGLFLEGKRLQISTDDLEAVKARRAIRELFTLQDTKDIPNWEQIFQTVKKVRMSPFHSCGDTLLRQSNELDELARAVSMASRYASQSENATRCSGLIHGLQQSLNDLLRRSKGDGKRELERPLNDARFVYIPTLRGMRVAPADCSNASNSQFVYFDRTYLDYIAPYQKETNDTQQSMPLKDARDHLLGSQVITGLEFHDSLTRSLLGSYEDREHVRSFQEYLSQVFFRGQSVTLIPRQGENTIYVEIGYEKEKPIQHVGDGLQHLIILMWPLFTLRDNPLFLFIEEPDLFLHPGYQRVLIDAITSESNRDLYVFVTTHSNQFVDVTLDAASHTIYRCRKISETTSERHDPTFVVERSVFGDRTLLHDLGVKASSLMFANCTIWVEGITDRLYLQRFLEIVMASDKTTYLENLHFAFVEYGGNNVAHWSFLDDQGPDVERICSTLFLVADKDNKKDKRHQKLKEVLGDRFYLLDVSEIENILSAKVIEAVITKYEGDLENCEPITGEKYKRVKLGRYIDLHVLKKLENSKRYNQENKRAYADKSGTVKGKLTFCKHALSKMSTMSDLTQEAIDLAHAVIKFIRTENT